MTKETAAESGAVDIFARAGGLAEPIREAADEAEAAGTLPSHLIGELESAGMFRMALPRDLKCHLRSTSDRRR